MHSYINSVSTGQAGIKGHFSAQFVKQLLKKLYFSDQQTLHINVVRKERSKE